MTATRDTITFLSDFGHDDEFVGVVKSVIRGIAPHATVVDLTHGIPPFDVRAGALALARAAQYLAGGVVLAVVDPGVGTSRRPVAVEVAGGEAVFVGPDNGLLGPAVAMVGGAERAVVLDREELHLPAPGATFAARDLFGPCAAALANGAALDDIGTAIDVASLLPGVLPVMERRGDAVAASVLWVDRFGNAQLNIGPEDLEAMGQVVALRVGDRLRRARVAATYGEIPPGEVGLVVDSYGLVSVCVDRQSAASSLELDTGDDVTLEPSQDAPSPATPVDLGRRR